MPPTTRLAYHVPEFRRRIFLFAATPALLSEPMLVFNSPLGVYQGELEQMQARLHQRQTGWEIEADFIAGNATEEVAHLYLGGVLDLLSLWIDAGFVLYLGTSP